MAQLRFTIVRQYPYVVFDQRDHLGSRIDHLSRPHLPRANDSVRRSDDSGVVQAAARCSQRSLMGSEAGGQLRLTGLEHEKPFMFGFHCSLAAQKRCVAFLQRGLSSCQLCSRALFLSDCLFKLLLGCGTGGDESFLPAALGKRAAEGGLSGIDTSLRSQNPRLCLVNCSHGAIDLRFLQLLLPLVVFDGCMRRGYAGFGLRYLRLKVVVLELDKKISRFYMLVVGYIHLSHHGGDL